MPPRMASLSVPKLVYDVLVGCLRRKKFGFGGVS